MDKRKKREQILFNLIAAAVLLLFLFPIYWMVITSLKSSKEIFAEVPTSECPVLWMVQLIKLRLI